MFQKKFLAICFSLIIFIYANQINASNKNITIGENINEELAYRVRFSKAEDITILLDKGANPDYINQLGFPMVTVAVSRKDDDSLAVLKALIEGGADFNAGGTSNNYPIILAINNNNTAIVKYLAQEKQADLSVKDLTGLTPLKIAKRGSPDKIITIIEQEKQRQEEVIRKLKSPTRRNILMKKWVKLQCEQIYMQHYFDVKLDKHSPEKINHIMNQYPPQFKEIATDLKNNFNLKITNFTDFSQKFTHLRLYSRFNKFLSNRMRRKKGFGTNEDMNKQCSKILQEFEVKLPKL